MRYVIMANGKGKRWGMHGGIPKHLIAIDGETLLQRTTRLCHELDDRAEVIISSSNPSYAAQGATRHAPERGEREIDRFCRELICDDVCFLYGDAFYTPEAMETIVRTPLSEGMLFFGSEASIVGVRSATAQCMLDALDAIDALIEEGIIEDAKGWQLYHCHEGMPLDGKAIGKGFVLLDDDTRDFNRPQDLEGFRA